MTEQQAKRVSAGERRFEAYLDGIVAALGHGGRTEPARAYCTGLLLPGARKSIEPMAARLEPARVRAAHQSLHHVVAKAEWSDEAVLAAVRERVLPTIERHGPIRYWIVDDTSFPKQGTHSVGVARQYCGQLGKQDNCQVAVTLSVANDDASLPIAYRLYLPKEWARDPERCAKAGVPPEVKFTTKPRLALQQIHRALTDGVPPGIVLMDAGYGNDTSFREALREAKLQYVGGIQSSAKLWPPGMAPLPPKSPSGRGRPPSRLRRSPEHQPLTAKALAKRLPATAWRRVTWREGSQADLTSRFAALRVRPAHRDDWSSVPREEEWLLIEWPESEADEILALQSAGQDRAQGAGRHGQGAVADRARFPRAEAGDRARALRGPRLARLPSPRRAVHRRGRLSRRRAVSFSPSTALRAAARPSVCATRQLPAARRRCDLSATSRLQSRPCAAGSSPGWSADWPDVLAVSDVVHARCS